jgi:hypothetical protein
MATGSLVLNRSQLSVYGYRSFWLVFLALFVVVGGRELWPELHEGKVLEPHLSASSDAYVAALLNVPDGAERWSAVEHRLPKEGSIIFFCPKRNAQSDLLFQLFSYLSWPRDIRKVEVASDEVLTQATAIDRASIVAAAFFAVQPPAGFTRGWAFGTQLLVVPLQEPQ